MGNVESNFYYKPKDGFDVIINERERERVNVIGRCVYMVEVLLFDKLVITNNNSCFGWFRPLVGLGVY